MQKEKIIQELEELKNDNRLRTIKTNDKSLYNFSSNDYLGLAHDKDLLQKFIKIIVLIITNYLHLHQD